MSSLDFADLLTVMAGVLAPVNLLLLVVGVVGGLIVGIIPGLGPTLAVALLIPITFSLPSDVSMSILMAVYVGGMSGGFLTAILMRVPGTPASIATTFDGFPMAQAGRAGQAIGNAIVANFIGTVISAICLMTLAPLLAQLAVKFYFAEYTAVCLFALTAVAAVSGSSTSRGVVSALIGLLVATVGLSPAAGLPRFDFGIPDLQAGIGLIPALIGLFAVSQFMKESEREGEERAEQVAQVAGGLPSLADIAGNTVNYLRSGLIGVWIGILPGLGGGPAGLIAYAQARNASKTPDRFGKGAVEGVIASETANNATIGGGLIPALTLGIPGDPTSAVLLGGLMIHGLQPGPQLFQSAPQILYGIYFSLFFSSVIMAVVLFLSVRWLILVVRIPRRILQPALIGICAMGAYSLDNRLFDVGVMFAFGFLGYLLERARYPLAPLLLGLILGPLIEGNLGKMLAQDGSLLPLVTRPIALAFVVLTVASLIWAARLRRMTGPAAAPASAG
jgi:putative tricarboxylic transport membrane protein